MACTITVTPSSGSSDWTGWITQQGLTDRGFQRVSLTEFATTAASLIGTGSVFELAGSIYSCSGAEVVSLAAATASADVSVYIVAIPSAGGTTCTFTLDDAAPTYVDAKQGFYASAASTSRYLGGAYIGTATTYFGKWLYTPDMIYGYLLPNSETRPLLKKKVEIGEWNMLATQTVTIKHNLGGQIQGVKSINVIIKRDGSTTRVDLTRWSTSLNTPDGYIDTITINNMNLHRMSSGLFYSTDYNATASTVANRGWATFEYEG